LWGANNVEKTEGSQEGGGARTVSFCGPNQRGFAADESSAATATRSLVLMSQNSSQVTQYASMG
jgi:hypothetical protein